MYFHNLWNNSFTNHLDPTWTKHAEGRSNILRHSPVTTFHNATFGENELILPVREHVAARTVLFPDFFIPVVFGFCSMLTQLIGWHALIDWSFSQDGKLHTFKRQPKHPEMNISLLLSTSETAKQWMYSLILQYKYVQWLHNTHSRQYKFKFTSPFILMCNKMLFNHQCLQVYQWYRFVHRSGN